MEKAALNPESLNNLKPLDKGFNKKKFNVTYGVTTNPNLQEIQSLSKNQCLAKRAWPQIEKINAWMVSAETGTFMKWGGLGVIASELPEAFNNCFAKEGDNLLVVTPLYLGDTKKKKATLDGLLYTGAEHLSVELKKIKVIDVPFMGDRACLTKYKVGVYTGHYGNTDYIFLQNDRFFDINPHSENPSAQDGCYVKNSFGINEVERFAFFSKAVYVLIKNVCEKNIKEIVCPNAVIANDWHSGALSGLTKYFTTAQAEAKLMSDDLAGQIRNIPIIHVAHHLGYQGWDYDNTSKILNSLYENTANMVFKNAKAIKNSNSRSMNTLIVHDCYNQASCNFHLADRVVTVSRNYAEEVSKELGFGLDFRDILKIRRDHRNFFGIVNGYNKKLISPNKDKVAKINQYFGDTNFKSYDENDLDVKLHNKKEFVQLISKIANDKIYRLSVIPRIDTYKFESIEKSIKNLENVPFFCASNRLVEQKGYDIAVSAILNLFEKNKESKQETPVIIMGGAGDIECYEMMGKLKDKVAETNPQAAKRIFITRGYSNEFTYAIQLASDFYLMPSRFEPCGLNQMEAMAKGVLPIVTSTGGLVDTVEDGVDGFRTEVFFTKGRRVYGSNLTAKRLKNNVNAYTETLEKALNTFRTSKEKIASMAAAAMRKDFSWDVENGSVYKYRNLLRFGHL